jgi:hypothetical protein
MTIDECKEWMNRFSSDARENIYALNVVDFLLAEVERMTKALSEGHPILEEAATRIRTGQDRERNSAGMPRHGMRS